jgi:glycosyltransferase involved in cell wall biosynthesis
MVRQALARAQSRGWRASAVFPEQARDHEWARALNEEFEVVFLPASPAAVSELLVAKETTILHTHFTGYDFAAAFVARRLANVYVVWHAHGVLPRTAPAYLRSLAKYTAARRLVNAIVCVGPRLAQEFIRRGASPRQTIYLPNGIDTERFRPAASGARAGARTALGLASDRPVVLHYGWSWQLKGGDLLCAAIGELRRRNIEITALTVGASAEAIGDARRFGVEDELVCLPQTEHVEQLLAASDVFALPSRDEGGNPPFSVLEALASGVPVVAGEIGGQTFGSELAAYRSVPLEPSAFADALEAQLGIGEKALAAARAHVETGRSLAAWANRLHALYDNILARRGPMG